MVDILKLKEEKLAKRKTSSPLEKFFHRIRPSSSHIFTKTPKIMPFELIIEVQPGEINKKDLEKYIPSSIALSINTSNQDIVYARQELLDLKEFYPDLPIIQHDIIVDPYQIYESRFQLMDHIPLYVCDKYSPDLLTFILLTREHNMRSILKIHNEKELDKTIETPVKLIAIDEPSLIGKNLNIDQIIELSQKVPQEKLIISRLINPTIEDLKRVKDAEINCAILPITCDALKDPRIFELFPKKRFSKKEENLLPL